jgi:hypothetical protein
MVYTVIEFDKPEAFVDADEGRLIRQYTFVLPASFAGFVPPVFNHGVDEFMTKAPPVSLMCPPPSGNR